MVFSPLLVGSRFPARTVFRELLCRLLCISAKSAVNPSLSGIGTGCGGGTLGFGGVPPIINTPYNEMRF
jgi:hypothetical protein